jgi:hypothetical protein
MITQIAHQTAVAGYMNRAKLTVELTVGTDVWY